MIDHCGFRSQLSLLVLLSMLSVVKADEVGRDLSPFRSCGLNSLFVIAKLSDHPTSLKSLEKSLGPNENGESSIADLERAAISLGLHPVSIKADFASLPKIPLPAIVHLKSRSPQSIAPHYVVLLGLHKQGVMTIDPPAGTTIHPYSEFKKDWSGVAITFLTDQEQEDKLLVNDVSWIRQRTFRISLVAVVVSIAAMGFVLIARRR